MNECPFLCQDVQYVNVANNTSSCITTCKWWYNRSPLTLPIFYINSSNSPIDLKIHVCEVTTLPLCQLPLLAHRYRAELLLYLIACVSLIVWNPCCSILMLCVSFVIVWKVPGDLTWDRLLNSRPYLVFVQPGDLCGPAPPRRWGPPAPRRTAQAKINC